MRKKSIQPSDNAIFSVLFPQKLTKSQRTQLLIAEGVILSCCNSGIEDTNFESVAKEVGLSRSIVNRYFSTKTSMIYFAAKYVRSNFQRFVVGHLEGHDGATELLSNYVRASLAWPKKFDKHAVFWMLVFYYCGFKREFREFNTEMVELGRTRLLQIVKKGAQEGVFRDTQIQDVSQVIHLYLTGAVLSLITQDVPRPDLFARQVEDKILALVDK